MKISDIDFIDPIHFEHFVHTHESVCVGKKHCKSSYTRLYYVSFYYNETGLTLAIVIVSRRCHFFS